MADVVGSTSKRTYGSRACCCITPTNPIRRAFISLIEWPWFDRFVLLLIILNCSFLAMQGPPGSPDAIFNADRAHQFECAFTVLFTIEMVSKMLAMGVAFHSGAYVRDPWNMLDMTVVLSAWAPILFPELDNLSAMRSVRALRPLRSVQRLPGLRRQVATMLNSLPQMADVALLGGFILLVYGVLGVQVFKGTLLYRCYEEGAEDPIDAEAGVCAPPSLEDSYTCIGHTCTHNKPQVFGSGCAAGEECRLYGTNPVYGTVSFDTIGWAWMTLFQCITMEGWVDVMYMEMSTLNTTVSIVYFVSLILLGSFYLLNLFLAVLYETYEAEQDANEEAAEVAIDEMEVELETGRVTLEEHVAKLVAKLDERDVDTRIAASEALAKLDRPGAIAQHATAIRAKLKDSDATVRKHLKEALVRLKANGANGADGVDGADGAMTAGDQASEEQRQKFLASMMAAQGVDDADDEAAVEQSPVGPCGPLSRCCAAIVNASCFTPFITGLIVVNTVLMMCEYHGMSKQLADFLESANLLLTMCFLGEMLLKLFGLGPAEYWSDPFNRFDAVVVVSSLLEVAMDTLHLELGLNPSFLRAFRLMRVFKLARSWSGLRSILSCVLRSLEAVLQLLALFALILFIFALLGVQLFGLAFTPENGFDEVPRTNYDTTAQAMMTVFVVMSGENWNDVWSDTKLAVGAWSAAYYVLMVVVGNYVVLNLFVAILLSGLEADDDEDLERKERKAGHHQTVKDVAEEAVSSPLLIALAQSKRRGSFSLPPPGSEKGCKRWLWDRRDHALLCLSPDSCLRRCALALIHFKCSSTGLLSAVSFDNMIILIILTSSGAMAFESCDLDPASPLAERLERINLVATAIFVAEMTLKILALGLAFTPNAYLKTGWNRLDGFIVCSSLLTLVGGGSPAIRVLRVLRVLRPLRLISKFGGMRIIVSLLLRTMPKVVNVLVVSGFILLIFAILGVQLFRGTFAACSIEGVSTYDECTAKGGVWANPPMGNFDNIFTSSLILFEMAGMEGWPDVMYAGVDAVSPGLAPVRDNNEWNALFFILWIIVGGMFLINLFVGVIVDTYTDVKEEEDGSKLMTDSQRQWVQVMAQSVTVRPARRPPPPTSCFRRFFHRIVSSPKLEPFILAVILFNTALIALDDQDVGAEEADVLAQLNLFCTCVFVVEATIKLIALGVGEYFLSSWNIFDFTVVALAMPDLLLALHVEAFAEMSDKSPLPPTLLRTLRIVRVSRVLRTIKSSEGLRALLSALLLSLPAMANLGGLFLIIQFLYAVLGMQLFGKVAWGEFLNADANFCTFGTAFLTMFRCATGESWNGIMHDAMITPDTYDPELGRTGRCSDEAGDCGSWAALPFFLSYTVVASFVALNMMIAVVLENFALSRAASDYKLSPEHSEAFVSAWAEFDPYATGYIALVDLGGALTRDDKVATAGLLSLLPEPLNVPFLTIDRDAVEVRPGSDGKASEMISFSVVNQTLLHTVYGAEIDFASDGMLAKFSEDQSLRWRRLVLKSALMVQRAWRNRDKRAANIVKAIRMAKKWPGGAAVANVIALTSKPSKEEAIVAKLATLSQKSLTDEEKTLVRVKQKKVQAQRASAAAEQPKSPKPSAESMERMRRDERARSASAPGFFSGLFQAVCVTRPPAHDESRALM